MDTISYEQPEEKSTNAEEVTHEYWQYKFKVQISKTLTFEYVSSLMVLQSYDEVKKDVSSYYVGASSQ